MDDIILAKQAKGDGEVRLNRILLYVIKGAIEFLLKPYSEKDFVEILQNNIPIIPENKTDHFMIDRVINDPQIVKMRHIIAPIVLIINDLNEAVIIAHLIKALRETRKDLFDVIEKLSMWSFPWLRHEVKKLVTILKNNHHYLLRSAALNPWLQYDTSIG